MKSSIRRPSHPGGSQITGDQVVFFAHTKEGSEEDPENYRPISLILVLGKVME